MAKKKSPKPSQIFLVEIFAGVLILAGFVFLKVSPSLIKNFSKGKDLEKILPTPALYPRNLGKTLIPVLTAHSYIVLDVDSGASLLEKDAKLATAPASTTKIMTALVSLENYRLDQILEVPEVKEIDGQKIKLLTGEKISAENLLYGLLVASANDAAITLARNFPGAEEGFVWAMNQKAKELNLGNTHFTNPVGYDNPNHYSTAADLARLALTAMKNEKFAQIVGTEKITITDQEGKIIHEMSNVNTLLGKLPGVKGIKTGWTQEAGECLVTYLEQNNNRIIISLLGSSDRFKETKAIIDWVLADFQWEKVLP